MEIRTDIKDFVFKYADVKIGIEHVQRENYLRFQRNIEYILGLKVGMIEYNKLCGVLSLNHMWEQMFVDKNIVHMSETSKSMSPRFYVTLHLGCYEEIACYLIHKEGKICVPVTERVYKQEIEHYNVKLRNRGINPSRLIMVNIESNTGLMQMIRYAQAGYSLLCYIDGNSGIGGMTRNDSKLEIVHFFNTTIHVRKGIEYMAKVLKSEVIPIYTYIEDISYQSKIIFMPPIEKNPNYSLTESLWQNFLHVIWKHFWQWEAWLYVDEFIAQTSSKEIVQSRYIFNTDRYHPLIKSGKYYYYDRKMNNLVKVGKRLFSLLSDIEKKSISSYSELIDYIPKKTLVDDILTKEMIIKI